MTAKLTRHLIRPLVLLFAGAGTLVLTTGPASAAVPGLVRVSATSVNDASNFKTVTATCPAGKQLTGTGYEIDGATGEVVIDELVMNGSSVTAPTLLTVDAYEEDPLATPWSVTAYGICANPLPGLVRISAAGPTNSDDFHSTTATCPVGKTLTGAGFTRNGIAGEAVVDDFLPNGGVAVAPTAITVGAYETDPNFMFNWSLNAYAICADPLPGQSRALLSGGSSSADIHTTTAACPAGKRLTGGGFEVTGATGEAVVDDFRPDGGTATAPDAIAVSAYEADPNYVPAWTLDTYGICANA